MKSEKEIKIRIEAYKVLLKDELMERSPTLKKRTYYKKEALEWVLKPEDKNE